MCLMFVFVCVRELERVCVCVCTSISDDATRGGVVLFECPRTSHSARRLRCPDRLRSINRLLSTFRGLCVCLSRRAVRPALLHTHEARNIWGRPPPPPHDGGFASRIQIYEKPTRESSAKADGGPGQGLQQTEVDRRKPQHFRSSRESRKTQKDRSAALVLSSLLLLLVVVAAACPH
jgi:hypothetical protein